MSIASRDIFRSARVALLLGSTALATLALVPQATAQQATVSYGISAGSLGPALTNWARTSGVKLLASSEALSGRSTRGLSGSYAPQQALGALLAGTGLTYNFNGSTVTVIDPGQGMVEGSVDDGAIQLETIDVTTGAGTAAAADAPYETPGPVSYISEETIQRFRGSSPADIFRGTPGVMSGEARNGGGSIDVNIRGMQGMGRVAVTIDGAMNSANVYQGYQGVSNRTFVDPDFLAGIDITKGSDVASNGIAGSVKMRTLDASDIVEDGKTFGFRAKTGTGGNTSDPTSGALAGYGISNPINQNPIVSSSEDGLDRPDFLEPTQGSASLVGAMTTEDIDLIAGYAYRKRGNYHAGSNGPSAKPVSIGPQPYCYPSGDCPPYLSYPDFVINDGIANYRAGEEVLNTQLETQSLFAKGTARYGDGHSSQLGYMRFESEAGDVIASRFASDTSRAQQQEQTVGTELDTFTFKHHWQPEANALIDVRANLWHTNLQLRNPRRAGTQWSEWQPEDFGLPGDFRVGSDNVMWGGDIANTSKFDTSVGPLELTYGASYLSEDTEPSPYTSQLEDWLVVRDGSREEVAGFVKAKWDATDWLTVNGGLRYQHFQSEDRTEPDPDDTTAEMHGQKLSVGGWSPQLGVTLKPIDGVQFYVNYSSAERAPSIMEALTGYSTRFNFGLRPERSNNWEIGTNLVRQGIITADDRGSMKFGYFNWDVENYLAREWKTDFVAPGGNVYQSMYVYNLERAKFEGLELSSRYEVDGFTAELAASYYLNIEFCRTADTCNDKSLYSDYATNQIPPEYSIDLTLTQKLMNDDLTIGGRVSHVGPRAIGHGEVTAQGLGQFIALVDWKPYTLVDAFAQYKFNENVSIDFSVLNLTDEFYVDPLSLVLQPGPGRTFMASMTAKF